MGIASEEGKAFLQDEKWMRLALEQARLAPKFTPIQS